LQAAPALASAVADLLKFLHGDLLQWEMEAWQKLNIEV
jgi:hypothetical protein